MKKITLKKRSASVMAGLLALVLVGGTWAYYNSTGSLDNKLSTKMPGGEQLVEQFTPEDDWTPGQEVTKAAGIENKSDVDLIVRVKMEEMWTLVNGEELSHKSGDANFVTGDGQLIDDDGKTEDDKSVVAKNMDLTNWTYGGNGWWYYTGTDGILAANGGVSGDFLKSITLAANADMGKKGTIKYYTEMPSRPMTEVPTGDPETGWAVWPGTEMPATATFSRSESSVDQTLAGYAGADYSLKITYETYQATPEAAAEAISKGWDEDSIPSSLTD